MGADTEAGKPSESERLKVTRRFFSGGSRFSFLSTITYSPFPGFLATAASITLNPGSKYILVGEKSSKSFVVV